MPVVLSPAAMKASRHRRILRALAGGEPIPLGVALFRAGMGTQGALFTAREMQNAGIITVARPTGVNLSCVCAITPKGLEALAMLEARADL